MTGGDDIGLDECTELSDFRIGRGQEMDLLNEFFSATSMKSFSR